MQGCAMKVLLWGDASGVERTVEELGVGRLAGVVGASNRASDWDALQAIARGRNVPFLLQPLRSKPVECATFGDRLRGIDADVFLVSSYSMILPRDYLMMPPLGTVNVHAALLPEYRGANVLNWVLVNGERETGVTVHYMDEGIDTGDIILQRRLVINIDDTACTLRDKLMDMLPGMVREVMAMLASGVCPRRAQESDRAKHWPRRRPDDGRIDWRWPAERIYNLIRALVKPWPGAFYETAGGERVVIDSFLTLDQVRALQAESEWAKSCGTKS
jgi:methionyl-tRNA formyltransferase